MLNTICFTFPRNATLYAIIWKRYVFKRKHPFFYLYRAKCRKEIYLSIFFF